MAGAKVTKGAVTSASAVGTNQPKMRGNAKKMREVVSEDAKERPIYYTATTGAITLESPVPLFDAEGRKYGETAGIELKFNHEGMSRALYPARYPKDAEFIAAVERFMERDPRTTAKIHLTKRGDTDATIPFAAWDIWTVDRLVIAIEANFTDDHDVNQRIIRDAARYETSRGEAARDTVLAMLDALLAGERVHGIVSDEIEVEV